MNALEKHVLVVSMRSESDIGEHTDASWVGANMRSPKFCRDAEHPHTDKERESQ